jgi:hypothetical protein
MLVELQQISGMQSQVQRSLKRRQTGVTESGKYCAEKFIYMRVRIADKNSANAIISLLLLRR